MRKLLLSLTILAGAAAAAPTVQARPALVLPVITEVPQVQTVQYYEDGRHREWRRREAYERWRRHEEWRRHHAYRGW